jgi:hypothetical protein
MEDQDSCAWCAAVRGVTNGVDVKNHFLNLLYPLTFSFVQILSSASCRTSWQSNMSQLKKSMRGIVGPPDQEGPRAVGTSQGGISSSTPT